MLNRALVIPLLLFCCPMFNQPLLPLGNGVPGLYELALKSSEEGNYDKAIEYCVHLLNSGDSLDSTSLNCIELLGTLYWNIGNIKESKKYYDRLIDLSGGQNIRAKHLIDIYQNYERGKVQRTDGQYDLSISSFKTAIEISRAIHSPEHEIKCERQLSLVYWDINNFREFYLLNESALKKASIIKHVREISNCSINIGSYYWKIDNYSRALEYFERAMESAEIVSDIDNVTSCLNNLGVIYLDLGNFDKALTYSNKALALDRELENQYAEAIDLLNIGAVYRKKAFISNDHNDYDESIKYFSGCLALSKIIGDHHLAIGALNNIGTILSEQHEYEKALLYFQSALQYSGEFKDLANTSMILNNIGIIQSRLGNYQRSIDYYQKSINLAQSIGAGQILWEAYAEIGSTYLEQGLLDAAIRYLQNSVSVIEDIRSSINLEEYRASFLGTDKRLEPYQNLIHVLLTRNRQSPARELTAEAFHILERAKARSFLDSMEVAEVDLSLGLNVKLASQERAVMRDISASYTKLLMPGLDDAERERISLGLKDDEDRLENLKREIRATSPAYSNLKYPEVITLDEALGSLDSRNTAYFAYCLGKTASYGFTVVHGQLKIFPLPGRETLVQTVMDYRKVISDKDNDDFSLGRRLFEDLIKPGLEPDLRNLVIVADDVLHLLPFETLVTEKSDPPAWLIEDYSISYIPSFSSLRELKRRGKTGPRPKDLLAFGNPAYGDLENPLAKADATEETFQSDVGTFPKLKYSGREVRSVSTMFKAAKADIFQGEDASEDRLKALDLSAYRILHFATHGVIDDQKPVRSSIILALDSDPREDGLLQMREIFKLKLNADLITLSSCRTGLGQFIRGEGVESLNRAFFYAGASSVLMSLWSVNDEATFRLMERFYHHLRGSEKVMLALRNAKLEISRSEAMSHPFYWAGFVITGHADRPVFPRPIINWIILAAVTGLGTVALVLGRSKLRSR